MKNFLIRAVLNGVALWLAALVVPGIHLGEDADSLAKRLFTIFLVAVIFGVVNAFVKPVATFFSIPFILVTLGLFLIVLNALMLQLTEWVSSWFSLDFYIDHFWWDAILGSLVISLVGMLLNELLPERDDAFRPR